MDEEVLSPQEAETRARGRLFKRYVRAAAALHEIYYDEDLADAVGIQRGAIGDWWKGARPAPVTLFRLAKVTGLLADELTRFVYSDGPPPKMPEPSGPAGLREGARRAEEHPDDATPGKPARSPGRLPRGGGAGRG
jgi:transcriptional regulator with XRE-family HTH domain